jgi:DNA (cytosine-5)-methyltransferase 1
MRLFIDLFCGAGGLTEGFKRAGWMPLCGVDVNYSAVQSYLANHGWSAECIIGSIEDPHIREQIVHTYKGRLQAVVGGPPCQGFSDANHNRSEDDERRSLPDRFIELAAELSPEWIVMEEVPAARGHAAG